jgi:hypothetical protein
MRQIKVEHFLPRRPPDISVSHDRISGVLCCVSMPSSVTSSCFQSHVDEKRLHLRNQDQRHSERKLPRLSTKHQSRDSGALGLCPILELRRCAAPGRWVVQFLSDYVTTACNITRSFQSPEGCWRPIEERRVIIETARGRYHEHFSVVVLGPVCVKLSLVAEVDLPLTSTPQSLCCTSVMDARNGQNESEITIADFTRTAQQIQIPLP